MITARNVASYVKLLFIENYKCILPLSKDVRWSISILYVCERANLHFTTYRIGEGTHTLNTNTYTQNSLKYAQCHVCSCFVSCCALKSKCAPNDHRCNYYMFFHWIRQVCFVHVVSHFLFHTKFSRSLSVYHCQTLVGYLSFFRCTHSDFDSWIEKMKKIK